MKEPENSKHFKEVVEYIDGSRKEMYASSPFFNTLKDESLPKHQRMLFFPYMLFFSLGSPDIKTLMMKIEKPREQLNNIEQKINNFIDEDNFHYNFYLDDLKKLGYGLGRFGSTSAVVRHVFSEEAIPVRKLVYAIGSYINPNGDQLVALTIPEIIEAGLYDLFTTVYKCIVKVGPDKTLDNLDYFGDTHVELEQNHTATRWFAPGHPEDDDVAGIVVPNASYEKIIVMVDDLMGRFRDMYAAFDEIFLSNTDISPKKFEVSGWPHIDEITSGKSAI